MLGSPGHLHCHHVSVSGVELSPKESDCPWMLLSLCALCCIRGEAVAAAVAPSARLDQTGLSMCWEIVVGGWLLY